MVALSSSETWQRGLIDFSKLGGWLSEIVGYMTSWPGPWKVIKPPRDAGTKSAPGVSGSRGARSVETREGGYEEGSSRRPVV